MTGETGWSGSHPDPDQPSSGRFEDVVRFRVLGSVSAIGEGGNSLNLGGPKQRTVLAMLLARIGMPVTADVIVEAVYGDKSHSAARRTVQTYISNLRGELGQVIVRDGDSWSLTVEPESIDSVQFEETLKTSSELIEDSPESASALLRGALSLWRGHPYSDVDAHGYLDAEVTRLAELRITAEALRIDADLAVGRHSELIGELEALVVEHPYMERFRGQHMMALYRAGRQKEALRSYADLRDLLVEELGVVPTEELQDLEQQILVQDTKLRAPTPASVKRRAVLVADPGDPFELARLTPAQRFERVTHIDEMLRSEHSADHGQNIRQAGHATYMFLDDPVTAAMVAQRVSIRDDGIRLAIDYGDVESSEAGVTGPPVVRASRLLASGHRGQVLISSAAQAEIAQSGHSGFRFEALGTFDLVGLDGPIVIHQLLVGEPVRTFPDLRTDRAPPPLPPDGSRPLPGYELHEEVRSGSLGVVYRGYQSSVGREVAIEVVPRSISSQPEFIRRFETETHQLSLLEHPHVLPILDSWRDTTGAFIVYPFHRGGTVARPETEFDVTTVLTQVASALAYAHGHGVVHGALRPDQVVLDEGGNTYLGGYAIGDVGEAGPDFAAFIPPEHFEGAPFDVAGDVFAMGVLAHELLTGEPWDPDTDLGPTPPAIARATNHDPESRQPSIEQLMEELSLGVDSTPSTRLTSVRNPYKGLSAFQESDAADFFGRSAVVADLVSALRHTGLLAVVGPSGIGKSSVVRAGLVPALRTGALPSSETWVSTHMTPGSDPFPGLQRAMERVAVDLPPATHALLDDEDPLFFDHLDDVLPEGSDLLLVVDQFEELFTMTNEPARSAFLDSMSAAAGSERCRVVITLRADYLDRPLRYSGFGALLRHGLVTLGSPSRDELAEAVIGPADNVGVLVEPVLVERLVSEVHDRPGALPLLQYSLVELFERRTSDVLTLDVYEQLGGVSGSLVGRAENVFTALDESNRATVRQVFLSLLSLTDDGAPARRRIRTSELGHLIPDPVLEAFSHRRLLVMDRDPTTHTPTVEVAHEALFGHWPRLAGWIRDLQDDVLQRRSLSEAATEWDANGRNERYLLSRSRVDHHMGWVSTTELELSDVERSFLETSTDWNEEQRRRRRRVRGGVIAGFAAAALIAAGFGLAAQTNATEARRAELVAEGRSVLEEDPELALLLGITAAEIGAETSLEGRALLHQALLDHRKVYMYTWPADRDIGVDLEAALSPSGSTLVATAWGSYVEAWDLDSDEQLWAEEFPEGSVVMGPTFSADGTQVMVSVAQAAPGLLPEDRVGLILLDAETGDVVGGHPMETCGVGMRPEGISDDWTVVSVISFDNAAGTGCAPPSGPFAGMIVDLERGEVLDKREIVLSSSHPASISPDGTMAAWLTENEIEVVSLDTAETLLRIPSDFGDRPYEAPAFSDDGRFLVFGRQPLQVIEIATGELITERPQSEVPAAEYSTFQHDDEIVVTTREDGGVSIWDPQTGKDFYKFSTSDYAYFSSMQGSLLSVAEYGGPHVSVWETGPLVVELAAATACPPGFSRSENPVVQGSLQLSVGVGSVTANCPGSDDPRTIVFDQKSGMVTSSIGNTTGRGSDLSSDGSLLVLQEMTEGEGVGPVSVYDTATGRTVVELEGFCTLLAASPDCDRIPVLLDSAFSPDDRHVVLVGADGRSSAWGVWDTTSGSMVPLDASVSFDSPPWPTTAQFSPDGVHLYVGGNINPPTLKDGGDTVQVYSTGDWSRIEATEADGVEVELELGPFTPDGKYFLGVGGSGAGLLDAETGILSRHLPGNFTVADISPDGRLLVTGSRDGFVEVWDLQELREDATRRLVERIPLGFGLGEVQNVAFSGNDAVWVTPEDGRIQLYTLDAEELVNIARQRITRSFTTAECSIYAIDPCPTLDVIQDD